MKRKLLFLLVCLLVLIPVTGKAAVSTELSSTCAAVCADSAGVTSSTTACESACKSNSTGVDSKCSVLTGTEKTDCYNILICRSNMSSSYCQAHVTYEDIENFENGEVERTINRVCQAVCFTEQENNYSYSGCMGVGSYANGGGCPSMLRQTDCGNEEACYKKEICKTTSYSNRPYCKSSYEASTYIRYANSATIDVDYQIVTPSSSGSESSSGSGAGTIEDDKSRIDGLSAENCYGFGEVVYYTSMIIKIFQIAAPIILIIWASVDLFKSIIANDEKQIIEKRKPIITRFISAACIFLVPWIVSTIVDNFTSDAEWVTCWKNNRYTYTSGDVNSQNPHHNIQSDELSYITPACAAQCVGKESESKCKDACRQAYWSQSTVCFYAQPGEGSSATVDSARRSCYNEFAQGWISTYGGE